MQQLQLYTDRQQVPGLWLPAKLSKKMCSWKAQTIRWQEVPVLWLLVPAVHATH